MDKWRKCIHTSCSKQPDASSRALGGGPVLTQLAGTLHGLLLFANVFVCAQVCNAVSVIACWCKILDMHRA